MLMPSSHIDRFGLCQRRYRYTHHDSRRAGRHSGLHKAPKPADLCLPRIHGLVATVNHFWGYQLFYSDSIP
ncbi:hypothetical protein Agabi119p4_3288 [Agaricus bisporus var. burnettii]|uniref:Uncharacterized protein n=1 Tax=Agaricus bisporus var. burnettii TaxID=192524 RepID=A0A8H7KJ12_AGABI|nr:hypothetical protein Agabi119p4_3288 [Agaricus bisporus var. burnettii]